VSEDGDSPQKAIQDFLNAQLNLSSSNLSQYVYIYEDQKAIEHLFRVVSGLESQIVGEYEILGQARQALMSAEKSQMVNLPLRYLFNNAIRMGRRVRCITSISKNAVSVSSAAVDLAADIVGDLSRCKVLIIGTGEAGQLAARVAREKGVSQIVMISRTGGRAQAIAGLLDARPSTLEDIELELSQADIVFACAGAPHRLLNVEQISCAMQKHSATPLVIIDIAMPRNVDPVVKQIPNTYLYNLDDLTAICKANRNLREKAIQDAEEMIRVELRKFSAHWQTFESRSTISALMSKAEEIRITQLNETLKKLPPLSEEQRNNLEAMTKSIVTRILQDPVEYLKSVKDMDNEDVVKQIFKLNQEQHR
jgi:glutamyl-tRNA reductase